MSSAGSPNPPWKEAAAITLPENTGDITVTREDTDDGIAVVTVVGDIDTVGQVRRTLLDAHGGAAAQTAAARTVIDLGHVTFLDSSGINVLIEAFHAAPADGWLRLARPTEPVQRVLTLVGVDHVSGCYPTVAEALHAPE